MSIGHEYSSALFVFESGESWGSNYARLVSREQDLNPWTVVIDPSKLEIDPATDDQVLTMEKFVNEARVREVHVSESLAHLSFFTTIRSSISALNDKTRPKVPFKFVSIPTTDSFDSAEIDPEEMDKARRWVSLQLSDRSLN